MTNRTRSFTHLLLVAFLALFIAACDNQIGDTNDSPESAAFFPDPADEWVLVWSDEFDGDSLDLNNWTYQLGDGSDVGLDRWGNNEQQWYTDQNLTVADGKLIITAKTETVQPGFPYTSSRINTKGKFDFKYGRVEASIKAPPGQGLWSAFWMLSTDSPYGDTWAATGEIDIFEAISPGTGTDLDFVGSTIYHGFAFPFQQFINNDYDSDATSAFNVYAVEWEQNQLRFFLNDMHMWTISSDSYYSYYYDNEDPGYKLGPDGAPFDQNFHILLNLAVGGNATGNEVDPAAVGDGASMEVEYVRVYTCAYNLPAGNGCNSNVDATLELPDPLRPATEAYDIYIDEPATYTWTIQGETFVRPLLLDTFFDNDGALVLSEIPDPDGGSMIDVNTTGGGNFSIYSGDGEGFELEEMAEAAEIRFDLYIDSANTDADGTFQVKMDSGFPALGFVEYNVADVPQDEWFTVSVKVNDLLNNPGDAPLNLNDVRTMFVFEPGFTTAMHAWIDNITLSCASPGGCRIVPPAAPLPPIEGPFAMAGIWQMTPAAGSLGVGPARGDITWFAIDDQGVSDRSCYYDDRYIFNEDGSFENILDGETWIEEWQSGNAEACGTPVAPFDGTTPGTWVYDQGAGTLTLDGFGSYVGIPKAVNAGELPAVPTPPNRTYLITEVGNNQMIVDIESGPGVWWRFDMTKLESFGDPGVTPERTFAGGWQVAPEAGSLGVGPARTDITWWSIDDAGVTTRACFYDDVYSFDRDGTFENLLGADTWLEAWQGVAGEECGAPVAPHDNSGSYTWTYTEGADADNGTLVIDGLGGYMGIPKAVNTGELDGTLAIPPNVTYLVNWIDDNNVYLDIEAGAGVWWRFKKVKTVQPPPLPGGGGGDPVVGTWRVAPEAGSLGVGPAQADITWWSIDDAGVTTRACFFDDDYVFNSDGSFENVLGADTWLEAWQGVAGEECGAPVAPHDGAASYTWERDEGAGTLTIDGLGGYLGIPKAVNSGELDGTLAIPPNVTYIVEFIDNDTRMVVDIEAGAGVWWRFIMDKQ